MPRSIRNVTEHGSLLTVQQVALLDNVSERTVRRAISTGLLEVVRVGPAAASSASNPRPTGRIAGRTRSEHS